MKSNILKTGIAMIIAITCSYNVFCNADALQNPSSIKSPSQVQLGGENNAFCNADALQNPSSKKSPSQVQLGGENNAFCNADGCQNPSSNISQRVNPLVDKKDKPQNSDSGWVQKDGYLENALQVGNISYFRYSNDGQYLFTFSKDKPSNSSYTYGNDYTFRKWDVKTGKVVKEKCFGYHIETNFDFDIYNDENTMILTYSGGGIPHSSETYIYVNDEIVNTIYSSKWINVDGRERIFNAYSRIFNKIKTILICLSIVAEGHAGSVSGGSYALWNLDSNKLAYIFPVYSCPNSVIISKNDKYALVASSYYDCTYDLDIHNSELFLINLETYELIPIHSFDDDINFHSLAFSNDSKYCVASKGSLFSIVWDIAAKKVKYYLNEYLAYSKFSMDNKFIITTIGATDYSMIKFYLAESGVEAECSYYNEHIQGSIAVAPDSINIAIAGSDGRIRIFQPKIFKSPFKTVFSADTVIKQIGEPIKFIDYTYPNATSWHWDFGDGTKSNERNPVHYYSNKGVYTVKLITTNGVQTDTMIKKDYVRMRIPVVANFDTYISQDTIPFKVKFNNYSQGEIISSTWIINGTVVSTEENPIIDFKNWGNYNVSLIVNDGYFYDTLFIKNRIKAIPPTIPIFTNKFENCYFVEDMFVYGVDGITTFDNGYLFIGDYYECHWDVFLEEYDLYYRYSLLTKTDSQGDTTWTAKELNLGGSVEPICLKRIIPTEDSCFFVIGSRYIGINAFLIKKYNQNGELIWEKTYPRQSNDNANNIYLTDDYGFMIIGASYYNYKAQTAVLKADKDGNQIWYKYFDGWGGSIINSGDENLLLVTYYVNSNDIMIIKIDKEGKIINQNLYEDNYNAIPIESIALKNGNIIVACYYKLSDYPLNYKSYLIMLDSNNNKIWEYLKEEEFNKYNSIVSLSDSLFLVTGNFNNQIGVDIINNQGELVNSVRFPERNGVINSIITTKDNDLFLTGSITPPYKFSQLYTLLLKHPYIITSAEDAHTENTANPEQPFSIFPNPTNSTATLQYKIETPTHLKIELINFIGMKVSELENAYKEAGKYSSLINFEKLTIAKGIYFVRFIANGNVFICKLVYV